MPRVHLADTVRVVLPVDGRAHVCPRRPGHGGEPLGVAPGTCSVFYAGAATGCGLAEELHALPLGPHADLRAHLQTLEGAYWACVVGVQPDGVLQVMLLSVRSIGGRGGGLPPSRAPRLCPATVPLTASASVNGICNRQ